MLKTLRNALFLILAALFLTACPKKQPPTPADTVMGNGSRYGSDSNLIANSTPGDWGPGAGDLPLRAPGEGIENGTYTDSTGKQWTMVENLLPSVYFGFDSSSISATERTKLQQAADHLRQNPNDALLIEGHCDWYGTTEYNLALGDRRANSASDYLMTLGISADRIDTLSKGSLEATSGLSKAQSSQDRRADLIILK